MTIPARDRLTLILAHGAGLPCDSPWMERLTEQLESCGITVVRFNFDYMTAALAAGKPRPPSRLPKLLEEFRTVLKRHRSDTAFVGGKSLGGRVASHLATEQSVAGLVVFGYPFHPPAKPQTLRTDHLGQIICPTLICQGERDPFGKRAEIEGYNLPHGLEWCWLEGGDHQFQTLKRSSVSQHDNLRRAAEATAAFMTRSATQQSSL